jgi:hypothetical protein
MNSGIDGAPVATSTPAHVKTLMDTDTFFLKLEETISQKMFKMKQDLVAEFKKSMQDTERLMDAKLLKLELKNKELAQKLERETEARTKVSQELKEVQTELKMVRNRCIQQEQYSRRENVKIFGLQQEPDESVKEKVFDFMKNKMKVPYIKPEDIVVAHRFKVQSEKARVNGSDPIMVRFVSRDIKQAVMRCRKNIRRSGVYVNEDLCRDQQALFNRIRNHDDAYQVWSWNRLH